MSHGLLEILRYFLLALIWLFFLHASRMVLVDVRRSRAATEAARHTEEASALHLRVLEPKEHRGQSFNLEGDLTLGRSPACVVVLADDSYASSVHARVYRLDGEVWLEDLGSTNGTFINDERLAEPARLQRGDKVKVGNTVLEVRR